MNFLSTLISSPRSLEEQLIEEESKLGGMVFSSNGPQVSNRRFWYFEGDWFFEQYYPNIGYQVIRYQILQNSMHKLFNGIEYAFDEGEKEILINAIRRYYTTVTQRLYSDI